MKSKIKMISIFMGILMVSLFFGGCSGNSKTKKIKVWSHLSDEEIYEVQKVANEWGKKTGNKVVVYSDKGDNKAYINAVDKGIGPDVVFGVNYTKIEKLYSEGLLDEIPQNRIDTSVYLKAAMDTVTFDNKIYGLPLSLDTYGLYYNKDKIKAPPKTFDELISMAQKYGMEYDINNFYLSYTIFGIDGTYIFKNNNGKYDVHDIGLNNKSAIEGYGALQDIVQKYKIMPSNIDNIKARKDFEAGKTGFYISGSWDIPEIKKSDVNFSVAEFPTYKGKHMTSFVLVQDSFVSSKSKNKDEAWDLLAFLSDKTRTPLYEKGDKLPAYKFELNDDEMKNNEFLSTFIKQSEYGILIPNVSENQALQDVNKIIMKLTDGKITPEQCGEYIVQNIEEFIEKQKQE